MGRTLPPIVAAVMCRWYLGTVGFSGNNWKVLSQQHKKGGENNLYGKSYTFACHVNQQNMVIHNEEKLPKYLSYSTKF